MAVLAILTPDFLSRCNHSSPDRCRRTLVNRLEFERRLACCSTLFLDLLEPCLDGALRHIPCELRRDTARMHSRSTHAAVTVAAVEVHCEKNIRGLRSPISHERLVRRRLKVGIGQVDITETMT